MGTISRYYSTVAVPGNLGVAGGISNAATSIWLQGTPSGYPSQYPFVLVVDENTSSQEAMLVTAGAGTPSQPWTVTRGFDGTLAVPHGPGATVSHDSVASDFSLSRAHEASDNTSQTLPHNLPPTAWLASSLVVINETITPNSTPTVQTWNAIPQTFAHLMVVVQGRLSPTSAKSGEATCTINGDTAAKYSYIDNAVTAETSLVQPKATTAFAQTAWNSFLQLPASQVGSSVNAGGGFAIFPNYAGTQYNKFALAFSGWGDGTDANAAGLSRWCYYNPSTQTGITSLSLAASSGTFLTGTFFGLYGLGG